MSFEYHKKAPAFLLKTYEMLHVYPFVSQKPEFSNIIQWTEEENGFVILSQSKFSEVVLPVYFKHGNLHSFIRQLNMYGFSKKRNKDMNYYHHPSFIKGKPQLIPEIQRKVEHKTSKYQRASTASIEANLPDRSPCASLLQMNYFLLMEQAANLQMILNDLTQDTPLKGELQEMVKEYLSIHGTLINKVKENEKIQEVQSTRQMLEKTVIM